MSRSRRRLISLAALVAGLLTCAPAAQAAAPDFVGVTSEDVFVAGPAYRNANLALQRSAGIGTIRQTFDWKLIETSPGRFDLRVYDAYVATLAAHGMRVLPILFNTPSFHAGTSSTRPARPPRSNATMARFAQVLVRRYGRNGTLWSERPGLRRLPITAWQIWNEPLLPVYWRGRPNARSYVRMVKTVSRAIRGVDRRAEIVSAGLPPSTQRGAVRLSRFIAQVYRAGIGRSINSLAINSYATNERSLLRLLRSVRKLMNRRGGRRDRIWITEIGWATSGPRSRFRVSASRQASLISRSFRTIRKHRRRLKIRGVVYFTWKDVPPYAPNFADLWGLHSGLLTRSGARKPSLGAFAGAARRLR